MRDRSILHHGLLACSVPCPVDILENISTVYPRVSRHWHFRVDSIVSLRNHEVHLRFVAYLVRGFGGVKVWQVESTSLGNSGGI